MSTRSGSLFASSRGVNRFVQLVGVAALIAWTGLGIVAWAIVARASTPSPTQASAPSTELLALSDELASLHEDVRALARGMESNVQALHADLDQRQAERTAQLESEIARLRDELAAPRVARGDSSRELEASERVESVREDIGTAHISDSKSVDEHAAASAAPAATSGRKSFLAFELPSDSFRFEGRRTWTVLPGLSRVGFDAKSTLHDFSGTTSRIEGTLDVDPSRPMDAPHARLRVEAASLATGIDGRDEALREHLATDEHPELVFELEAFDAAAVDVAAQRVTGMARGKMTIRGVTREFAMTVKLSVDTARRLCLEGEALVHLPDYGVPVPSKLGVLSMDEDVKVWISIKLRASGPAEQ